MTVQQDIPVSEPAPTAASSDASTLSSAELQKQLEQVALDLRLEDVQSLLDPDTPYVRSSLTASLKYGYIELAQMIMKAKNENDLVGFSFRHLSDGLARRGNWTDIQKVLDFLKGADPICLADFKKIFQQENKDFIVWWKENYPDFPGEWLVNCSVEYATAVTGQIKLSKEQINAFVYHLVHSTPKSELLEWAAGRFFKGIQSMNLEQLFNKEDLFPIASTTFIPSTFENAVRLGALSYLDWCVACFGPSIKNAVDWSKCLTYSTCSIVDTLNHLDTLVKLTKEDILRNKGALIDASFFSVLEIKLWVLRKFDFTPEEIAAMSLDNANSSDSWYIKLLQAPASVKKYFNKVIVTYEYLAEVCMKAVREEEMVVVRWIFDNVPQSCYTTSFLREIHCDMLEIGNIELLDLFYNMDEKLDAAAFNYRLFCYIFKPEVLDWIHEKMGINEKHLETYELRQLHPNTLCWFLKHGILTKESERFNSFDLVKYVIKNKKHCQTITKILKYVTVNEALVLPLMECSAIEDNFIIHLIREHELPKNSKWLMLAAEKDRCGLLQFLLSHYRDSIQAWEVFTPQPLSFEARNIIRVWVMGYAEFEKVAWSCESAKGPKLSIHLAIVNIDNNSPFNTLYTNVIQWVMTYHDLKKNDPIWQDVLTVCKSNESKSFIEHDIMGMERKPLTLRELGDGLASGKITLKPNTELSLLLKLCQQVAELSTGTENAEKEAALMQDFQEHILQ